MHRSKHKSNEKWSKKKWKEETTLRFMYIIILMLYIYFGSLGYKYFSLGSEHCLHSFLLVAITSWNFNFVFDVVIIEFFIVKSKGQNWNKILEKYSNCAFKDQRVFQFAFNTNVIMKQLNGHFRFCKNQFLQNWKVRKSQWRYKKMKFFAKTNSKFWRSWLRLCD